MYSIDDHDKAMTQFLNKIEQYKTEYYKIVSITIVLRVEHNLNLFNILWNCPFNSFIPQLTGSNCRKSRVRLLDTDSSFSFFKMRLNIACKDKCSSIEFAYHLKQPINHSRNLIMLHVRFVFGKKFPSLNLQVKSLHHPGIPDSIMT